MGKLKFLIFQKCFQFISNIEFHIGINKVLLSQVDMYLNFKNVKYLRMKTIYCYHSKLNVFLYIETVKINLYKNWITEIVNTGNK